jgi:hypothetical protein
VLVAAAAALVLAGVCFATFVGWDTSAGVHLTAPFGPPRCSALVVGQRLFVPTSDVPNGRLPLPEGSRVVVHHRWFHPFSYTLITRQGTRVPLTPGIVGSCGTS